MRSRHDQSSISARLDGTLTVGTYIRRQWLRDFQKTLDRCDIRSNSARLPTNHSVFLRRHFVARIASRPPGAFRKRDAPHFRRAITGKIVPRITIRQRHLPFRLIPAVAVPVS